MSANYKTVAVDGHSTKYACVIYQSHGSLCGYYLYSVDSF